VIALTCEHCGAVYYRKRKRSRFCSKRCIWEVTKGPEFNRRIGAEFAEKQAATQRRRGEGRGYVKYMGRHEHRVVAEKMLGRPLRRGEVVHHTDGDKLNNDPSNLVVMRQGEHMREHGLGIPGKPLWWEPWKKRQSK